MDTQPDPDTQSTLDSLLFDAIVVENEEVGLQLLERGANPLAIATAGTKATAFERAAEWGGRGLPGSGSAFPKLVPAMLTRVTPTQKNELLVACVLRGSTAAVRALLTAGADPRQRFLGMPLIDAAPDHAEVIRRMLRAIETAAAVEAAMERVSTMKPGGWVDVVMRRMRSSDTTAAIEQVMGNRNEAAPAPSTKPFTL